MWANRDPLGYYAALGIDPSASTNKIKKAFRAKAQELHPDKNRSADATQSFQLLNEAYQVLGDPGSRSEYDSSSYTLVDQKEDPKPNHTSFQSIACCVCGKISIQPRYVIYRQVVSFIFATYRSGCQGVFCAKCGAKQACRTSLLTWMFGWWGIPWGPIYSIQAIVRNTFGGEQPDISNFRILAMQAAHFASAGRMDLARLLADQAIEFVGRIPAFQANQESSADRGLRGLLSVIQSATPPTARSLKPVWGIRSLPFRIQVSAAGLLTLTVFVLLTSGTRSGKTAYRHLAPGYVFDQTESNDSRSTGWQASGINSAANTSWGGIQPGNQGTQTLVKQPNVMFNQPVYPLPKTGRMHMRNRNRDVMAPSKIASFRGSPNYYLKLIDLETHGPVMFLFIRSGEVVSTNVPLGRYELHYANGLSWYGEDYRFGPDTDYSKADAKLIFEREGDNIAGYTIRLDKQPEGNLKEIPITPAEF